MQNLYIKFYDKFKFSSLIAMQNRLSLVSFFDFRQARIIVYFKRFVSYSFVCIISLSKIKLVSIKQYNNSKKQCQLTQNRDLTSNNIYKNILYANHLTYSTCRRCKQHFISKNILYKHIRYCNSNT